MGSQKWTLQDQDYKSQLGIHGTLVASFPGLPVFSVLQFPLTIIHGCGRAAFHIRVLLSTETEEQKKRGRPGNEASTLVCRWDMGQRSIATHTT